MSRSIFDDWLAELKVDDNTRLEIPTPMLVEKIEHAKLSDWLGRTQPTLLQLKAMKKAHDDNA